MYLTGITYEDPEGIWLVQDVDDNDWATVVNVQKGNLNEGKTFYVEAAEIEYWLENTAWK